MRADPDPAGYLITFAGYGSRLHGDAAGTSDRLHSGFGMPYVPENADRVRYLQTRLQEPPLFLSPDERDAVLDGICQCAERREWKLHAAHVRSNHAHLVAEVPGPPEPALSAFKAYASRWLKAADLRRNRYWAHHGSTAYLWQPRDVDMAVEYVVERQGAPMAVYLNPRRWD